MLSTKCQPFCFGPNELPTFTYWIPERYTRAWFNIKMSSYRYSKSHFGDKTVKRSSYFHSGICYTGKMTSLSNQGLVSLIIKDNLRYTTQVISFSCLYQDSNDCNDLCIMMARTDCSIVGADEKSQVFDMHLVTVWKWLRIPLHEF